MNKVLLVDDDPVLRKLLSASLQKHKNHFLTIFAADGEEAIEILVKEDISLLVTDIRMPKIDGLELLSYMSSKHPKTPCIVLTSYVLPGLKQKLLQKVLHFLEKPIAPQVLAETIIQSLGQANRNEALSGVSLPGLMQIIETEEKTCLLSIHADGEKKGLIYFHEGEVYDALCGELKGEAAATKLIAMDDVQVHHKQIPEKKIFRRQITAGVQTLILEAMRLKDEAADEEETDQQQEQLLQQTQDDLLEKGKTLCEGLHFKKAQKPLLELVQKHPDNIQGWLWLSRTLSNMKQLRKALTMATKIDSKNMEVNRDILKYSMADKICNEEMIRCHFCYAPVPLEANQCHYCNAYFKITKEIVPKINKNIDQKELRQAISRYENVLSREVNTKVLFYAGLAWMHLDNFDATLDFFEQLQLSIGNNSSIYKSPVEHIVAYIASKQAEKESIKQPKKQQQSKDLPVLSEISRNKNILVVEDSPTTRKVIKMTLNSNGFHVDEAADGIEALSKLNDTHPDLILLDVMLPKLDGYGILSVLKKNEALKHIPVIMLTSKDSLRDKLKGRFSSASAYLTKPFKPNELIVKVNKFTM